MITIQLLVTNKLKYIMKQLIILFFFLLCFSVLRSQYVLPSGGEDGYDWRAGTTQVISWSKYFMDTTKTIDILLWNADSASFSTIATNIPVMDEYYLWSIPSIQPTGEQFKIKIVYHKGFLPMFKYMSNDFFSIKQQQSPPTISYVTFIKSKKNSFTIYPNPSFTSNVINIKSASQFYGIEIYDVLGSLILDKRFNYTNNYELKLDKFASGAYTVLVRFMGNTVTEQLSISK